jgi:phosphatidylglycerophosphatase A
MSEVTSGKYERTPRHTIQVATAFPHAASFGEKLQHLVSIGGPIGFIPWVPATWASLVTALVWFAVSSQTTPAIVAVATVVLFVLGGITATTSERVLQSEDPRNVVIDEIAGQTLTFLLVAPVDWQLALAGFAFFRIFDVLKPFPARRLEHLYSGWGIMADDIMAGLYGAIALFALHHWVR